MVLFWLVTQAAWFIVNIPVELLYAIKLVPGTASDDMPSKAEIILK